MSGSGGNVTRRRKTNKKYIDKISRPLHEDQTPRWWGKGTKKKHVFLKEILNANKE